MLASSVVTCAGNRGTSTSYLGILRTRDGYLDWRLGKQSLQSVHYSGFCMLLKAGEPPPLTKFKLPGHYDYGSRLDRLAFYCW